MQQLRFVGVHDDGEHLIFESNDGEQQFRAYIDSSLRNAVVKARRAHPARSLSGDGVFGPRDIQTRFRQGATVEEIVEESGWKPERVRRYEWPILAERSHVVAAARTVPVDSLDPRVTHQRTLNDQVVAVREHWHCAESEAQWNSWQREDGLWNVTISIEYSREALRQLPPHCDFPARFVYNPANQTVTAANAVGEFLFGKLSDPQQGEAPVEEPARQLDARVERPAPGAAPAASGQEQPSSAVPEEEPQQQDRPERDAPAAGGAGGQARSHLSAVPQQESTPTEQLLDELEQKRGTAPDPSSAHRVADLTQRLREASPAAESTGTVSTGTEAAEAETSVPAAEPEVKATDSEKDAASRQEAPRGKGRRPSVPSWDDIVFGQHRKN